MKKTALLTLSCIVCLIIGVYLGHSYKESLNLKKTLIRNLPGFSTANLMPSIKALSESCKSFMKQPESRNVGSPLITIKVSDWKPLCEDLKARHITHSKDARKFIEQWFTAYRFYQQGSPKQGLFTGYYLPLVDGREHKTETYNVPIFATPTNLVRINLGDFSKDLKNKSIVARIDSNRVVPYHDRKAINEGAINKNAKVIAWVSNRVDRLFLGIQGSGYIQLPDDRRIVINYDEQNGHAYTALAQILINDKIMTRDNASMQRIRAYFEKHPDKIDHYINQNRSFVFYRVVNGKDIIGAQNVPLTAGYSLAVDRHYIPLGLPLWLSTTSPNPKKPYQSQPFKRLMVAQDTGGAIKGPVRGDVFWGGGETAAIVAGHMKNRGYYWLLIPKGVNPSS